MDGMAFTKSHEGVRAKVYTDTVGKKTVGVGFNMDAPGAREHFAQALPGVNFDEVRSGVLSLTPVQITDLYAYCYTEAELAAARLISNFESLPQPVQCVVIDNVFQLGEAGYAAFKKTRQALGLHQFAQAADEMQDSVWFRQVPNRAKECVAVIRSFGAS